MPKNDQTILGSLLRMLGAGEKQRFRRWLLSQNKGQHTQTVQLFDAWMAHAPHLPPDEILWATLFPEKKEEALDDLALRRIKSRLTAQVKAFLAVSQVEENEDLMAYAFLKKCLSLKVYELYPRLYHAYMRKLDKRELHNTAYFQHRFEVLSGYQSYLVFTGKNIPEPFMEDLMASMELWYLHQKFFLSMIHLGLNLSKGFSLSFNLSEADFENALAWEQKRPLPLLSMYRNIIRLNTQPEKGDFDLALENLITLKDLLPSMEKQNNFRFLLNIGIRSYNQQADLRTSQNLLDLIRLGISEHLIQDDEGRLPTLLFRAMVESALRTEGPDATETDIQHYLPLLPAEDQLETAAVCKALLFLHRRQYSLLKEHLQQHQFRSINDQVRRRFFLLQANYELHPEQMEDEIIKEGRALQKYLQRHEINLSQRLRERYLRQIGWFVRFLELRFDTAALSKLEERMLYDAQHPFTAWLLDHIRSKPAD